MAKIEIVYDEQKFEPIFDSEKGIRFSEIESEKVDGCKHIIEPIDWIDYWIKVLSSNITNDVSNE